MTIVRVIASNQELTQKLIGEEYNAISMNLDTGSVKVYDEYLGGQITLNKDEYRFVIH